MSISPNARSTAVSADIGARIAACYVALAPSTSPQPSTTLEVVDIEAFVRAAEAAADALPAPTPDRQRTVFGRIQSEPTAGRVTSR